MREKFARKICEGNLREKFGLNDTTAVSPPGEWGLGPHSPLLPLLPLPTPPTSHSSHPSLYLVQILVTPHSTFLPLPTPPTPPTPTTLFENGYQLLSLVGGLNSFFLKCYPTKRSVLLRKKIYTVNKVKIRS